MFKLDLERAEESEIKLSTSVGSQKTHTHTHTHRVFQKNICFIDYVKAFDCVDYNKLENSSREPLTVWITTNWKILQEMGIPDHLTCLLRNLYAGQEATVRTGHGTTDWFQFGKDYVKAVYCHPAYLTSMQSTS